MWQLPRLQCTGHGGRLWWRAGGLCASALCRLAARSAWLFIAGRVIVIDWGHHRLEFVRSYDPAEVHDYRGIDDMAVFIKN